jgi:hypothetical protein
LTAGSAQDADTLTVVLSEPVQLAHVLSPTNDSERLLFRHFLDNLIRLDCQGKVRPSLAQSWSADSEGRVWTLTLREGAHFPGGTPVDPLRVASLLTEPQGKAAGIDSAVELDHRRVRIYLHQAHDDLPTVLAEPALAMLDGLGSVDRPVRRFDIAPRDGRPFIRFEVAQNGDPRDALDRGIDLLVTRDPAVVEYVATRPEFAALPLPWDRTYVLVQPAGAEPVTIAGDSVRRSLARDAVRAEARPAESPFWWDSLAVCPVVAGPQGQRPSASRIVYPGGDQVARGLAERIVALSGSGTQLRAAALGQPEFATALREGTERAYVLQVQRRTFDPCREATPWPSGVSIQPLIDTRARAIVRRGSPALTVDWDGTVRVVGGDADDRGPR